MYRIGFANKYYTLWEVSINVTNKGNRNIETTNYHYLKNISFDLDKVKVSFPDVDIDETLKGRTVSFKTQKIIWTDVDTFRFGKYSGLKIAEVNDLKYTKWYWDQIDTDHRDYVTSFLENNGYVLRGSFMLSPDEYKKILDRQKQIPEIIDRLECGDFRVKCEKNLNEFGEYRSDAFALVFKKCRVMSYRDCYYALPMIGKVGKKIKGKEIIILDADWNVDDDYVTINVEQWAFVN